MFTCHDALVFLFLVGLTSVRDGHPRVSFCQDETLPFECIIEGDETFVWKGALLQYSNSSKLSHEGKYNKSCNVRAIVLAYKEEAENDHMFMCPSQPDLNRVLLSPNLDSAIVKCFYDNRSDVSNVDIWTVIGKCDCIYVYACMHYNNNVICMNYNNTDKQQCALSLFIDHGLLC